MLFPFYILPLLDFPPLKEVGRGLTLLSQKEMRDIGKILFSKDEGYK